MATLTGQEDELARLEAAREQAAEGRRQAEEAYQAAKAEHERQQQAEAPAHAAHGLGPGDTCPVCTRVLPATFQPPKAPSLDAAQRNLARAEQRRADAREAATRADTQAKLAKGLRQ